MNSHRSIQHPKKLDPRRKALVKQLQKNIANSSTYLKRKPSHQHDEYFKQDTLSKKQHIDLHLVKSQNQNQIIRKQNNTNLLSKSQKQLPINSQLLSDLKISDNKKESPDDAPPQNSQHSQNPLNKKILPSSLDCMMDRDIPRFEFIFHEDEKIFSEKERLLISIQSKLDSYLVFLKENRKKKKGEFFTQIKKYFLENYRIFLEFSHLKKILYIDENLYSVQRHSEGVSIDCLVDIKLTNIQPAHIQDQLKNRRVRFRSKMFDFKQKFASRRTDQVEVPEVKFQFQEIFQSSRNFLKQNVKTFFDGELLTKKKIDKFFVLQSKNSKSYKLSKNILTEGIKKVQKIIKKEKQIESNLFVNKIFQNKELTVYEIESIIEEINIFYRNKNVNNLFIQQLVDGIAKKIFVSQDILTRVVEIFIEASLKINPQKPFLKQINHKTGKIIQIDKNILKEFKSQILSKEWMAKFVFNVEMNQEYIKKKLQEERQKVYMQVKKNNQDHKIEDQITEEKEQNQLKVERFNQLKEIYLSGQPKISLNGSQEESKVQHLQNGSYRFEKKGQVEKINCAQNDQFRSSLSNSENIFYEDSENANC